jgi:hypothetical protein
LYHLLNASTKIPVGDALFINTEAVWPYRWSVSLYLAKVALDAIKQKDFGKYAKHLIIRSLQKCSKTAADGK